MPGLGLSSGTVGGGFTRAQTINQSVPLSTGAVGTVPSFGLLSPTFAKTGGNANLTLNTSTGVYSATVALTAGATQSFTFSVTGSDGMVVTGTLNATGAVSVPSQVGTVTPTAASGQVALAWSAPANGGSAITDYLVEYKLSASGTWLTFADGVSASTGATVTGLTNASAYDFRVSAINAVGTGTASATVSSTPASGPVHAIPSDAIFKLTPNNLVLADNTTITSGSGLTDPITGAAITPVGTGPKYRTSGLNSKPYFSCTGANSLKALNAALTSVIAAINAKEITVLFVTEQVSVEDGFIQPILSDGSGGNFMYNCTKKGGGARGGNAGAYLGEAGGLDFRVTTHTGTVSDTHGGSGGVNLQRAWTDGINTANLGSAPMAFTAGNDLGLLGQPTNTFYFTGRCYEILIFARALTPDEILSATLYYYDYYAQTHPINVKGSFLGFIHNSRGANASGTAAGPLANDNRHGFAAVTAECLGYTAGTWGNYSIGGINTKNILTKVIPEIQLLKTYFPTGVNWNFQFEEVQNDSSSSVVYGPIGTVDTHLYNTKAIFTALRATFGVGAKLAIASPIDVATVQVNPDAYGGSGTGGFGGTASGGWLTYVRNPTNWAALGADFLIDWANSPLGSSGDGTFTTSPYNILTGPNAGMAGVTDGIHPPAVGYYEMAKIALNAWATQLSLTLPTFSVNPSISGTTTSGSTLTIADGTPAGSATINRRTLFGKNGLNDGAVLNSYNQAGATFLLTATQVGYKFGAAVWIKDASTGLYNFEFATNVGPVT